MSALSDAVVRIDWFDVLTAGSRPPLLPHGVSVGDVEVGAAGGGGWVVILVAGDVNLDGTQRGEAVLLVVRLGQFRAQIEVMLEAGLLPTPLDWHCLADGGRDDVFDLTLALAQKYEIGVRAWTEHGRRALRALGLPAQDQEFLDSFSLPVEGKQESVLTRIRALPEGLSEWAMHPARPHPADTGSDVRSTDYQVLMAESTRQVLQ